MSQDSTNGPVETRKLAARRRREIVAVLLFSGGPIFESSIPLSVFGIDRQDAGVPRYRLLVCAGEDGPLRTTGGLQLSAPYGLEAISRAGTVVVPAWRSITQPPPPAALDALRRAHEEGARVIGLCTGAFVLAAAGLLDGRPATTHWMYAPTLAKRYPAVHVDPRELFVDDGDILTSAGTAAGIDLCLHVVRTDHGAEAAGALARRLVIPPRRGSGQETGGHPRHLDRSLPEEIGADPLAEVVAWALEHLHEQFDVETLAARAYMSRRTFDRRFRSLTGSAPLQWLITQRVLQAQRLLETSDYSVDEVAGRCGFRSPVALRGHFRRQLGASPAAYRAAYRARRLDGEQGGGPGGSPGPAGPAGVPGGNGGEGSDGAYRVPHQPPSQAQPGHHAPGAGHPGAGHHPLGHPGVGHGGPPGGGGTGNGQGHEPGQEPGAPGGQGAGRGTRQELREYRNARENRAEQGKPVSDAFAPRVPGQRGRGAG
ncbi:helix-turn-helix domain-containing protein [Streptomyces albus subsp. chlorinus]|uniref:helix-turn-helix domain-containing protein n=1 Tax=Streptomyces albus TaxID=1888 RepID=UPI00156D9405|nr:helix-turn-helix domain-containing protein [Streptomyces albus]NSC21864.1 helix-turn-helix domain-containing protein [Streptomyces albus subsp. chlorinus]